MKAITVRQPWAWLLIEAPAQWRKPVENRPWETKYRGWIQIHAAKNCTQAKYDEAVEFVRGFNPTLASLIPPLEKLARGGIIGSVFLSDCVSRHPSRFFTGPFGFVMDKPMPVPFKPMRGMLGIFNTNANGEAEPAEPAATGGKSCPHCGLSGQQPDSLKCDDCGKDMP
jgi:hypothetical protein